jgi:hypothetical protein
VALQISQKALKTASVSDLRIDDHGVDAPASENKINVFKGLRRLMCATGSDQSEVGMIWEACGGDIGCWRGVRPGAACPWRLAPGPARAGVPPEVDGSRDSNLRCPERGPSQKIFKTPRSFNSPTATRVSGLVEGLDCLDLPGYGDRSAFAARLTGASPSLSAASLIRFRGSIGQTHRQRGRGVVRLSAGKFRALGSRDGADAWAAVSGPPGGIVGWGGIVVYGSSFRRFRVILTVLHHKFATRY